MHALLSGCNPSMLLHMIRSEIGMAASREQGWARFLDLSDLHCPWQSIWCKVLVHQISHIKISHILKLFSTFKTKSNKIYFYFFVILISRKISIQMVNLKIIVSSWGRRQEKNKISKKNCAYIFGRRKGFFAMWMETLTLLGVKFLY